MEDEITCHELMHGQPIIHLCLLLLHLQSFCVVAAITATGVIWSRYSVVINPVNYNLLAVNAFMAMTGFYQIFRKLR